MKTKTTVSIVIIAILATMAIIGFSSANYAFRRDRIIESGNQGVPQVSITQIGVLGDNFTINLESESIDGAFVYSIVDISMQRELGQLNYSPAQEYRPLFEALGNGDFIIGKQLILTSNGELIRFEDKYGTYLMDYAIHGKLLAIATPDKTGQTSDGLSCQIALIDLDDDYNLERVDSFTLAREISFDPSVSIAFDDNGYLYYDYYDFEYQIRKYDFETKSSDIYLSNAWDARISPFNSYMLFTQIQSVNKLDRQEATIKLVNLRDHQVTPLLSGSINKIFWLDDVLIIYNDQRNLYDVYTLGDKVQKTDELEMPFNTVTITGNSKEYNIEYYDYSGSEISLRTTQIK